MNHVQVENSTHRFTGSDKCALGNESSDVMMLAGTETHRARHSHGTPGMIGWTKLPENREEPVMRALVEQGPAAIHIAVDSGFSSYSDGILTVAKTPEWTINHGV